MLCHLLLISIVLIIYAFLPCVPSMFHLIPFGRSIIYSYHLHIPIMSLSIHILSIFLSCSIYSFMYYNHMFNTYNLIFICAYQLCTFRLSYLMTYPIISYHILLLIPIISYDISYINIIFMFYEHIYTYCIFYIFLVSWLLHIALHILMKYDVYEITPHSYILIPL